jgi:predicted Rossmann fold flavoprotein
MDKIAVIGAGPAGCTAAYYLLHHAGEAGLPQNLDVTVFDFSSPLRTLLPTGGGRCNLAYAEYDFKELAKCYPRGEKFLYSVFSKFAAADTLEFFKKLGIKTYTQDNNRIFPVSNSAKDVRERFLHKLKGVKFVREKVLTLTPSENLFDVTTDKNKYVFDKVIIATGGHASYEIIKQLGHTIIEPKPALTGLKTREDFSPLAGVSIEITEASTKTTDNHSTVQPSNHSTPPHLLFTHAGISGPLTYVISSLNARTEFPYTIKLDFTGEVDLQKLLNENPHKTIKNLLSDLVPKSLAAYISGAASDIKCHKIDGKTRDKILRCLRGFEVTVTGTVKDGEVVTCGGAALNEIDPKTLQSKLVPGLYFCGEVLDIDGLCGGFNLQNCWSTGFAAAQGALSPADD